MTTVQASGKYVKTKIGLFSTTSIAYNGDGPPPPEFLELDHKLTWYQKPWAFWLNSAFSAFVGWLLNWLLT